MDLRRKMVLSSVLKLAVVVFRCDVGDYEVVCLVLCVRRWKSVCELAIALIDWEGNIIGTSGSYLKVLS